VFFSELEGIAMAMTDQQVRMIMKALSKHGNEGMAAAKAGVCRQTAAKYRRLGKLPSELKSRREWRTRPDPFAAVWPDIEARLREAPGLWARTLFEELQEHYPGQFPPGQLRTLHRRVQRWRALHGDDPAAEVFFPQQPRPGEAAQTDFTHTGELGMTLQGEPYAPLLCPVVLPYSNWQWACRCRSESLLALKRAIQEALFRLGRVPEWHQTDNSTGATHRVRTGQREFNREYRELMAHLGMKPRTLAVGQKAQNGTVEAQNGAFNRFLKQALLGRGSSDFVSEAAFDAWVEGRLHQENHRRQARVQAELAVMQPLTVDRFPEFKQLTVRVSQNSTINVLGNLYSVPPRLVQQLLRVQVDENHVAVFYGATWIQEMPRLTGRSHHAIDYRHVIWSLVQKPGAFARYRYREALFPTLLFRRAYAALQAAHPGTAGDAAYLRRLPLAASTQEAEVQAALELVLEAEQVPEPDRVRELVRPALPVVPALAIPAVELASYDALLGELTR
jgi:transposase InsO family protein